MLSERGELDLADQLSSINLTGVNVGVFETLLWFVPCTAMMFVEACKSGYDGIVKAGLKQGLAPDGKSLL